MSKIYIVEVTDGYEVFEEHYFCNEDNAKKCLAKFKTREEAEKTYDFYGRLLVKEFED